MEVYISMGRVLAVHESRMFFRTKAQQASTNLKNIRDFDRWDYPESGGTGWESQELTKLKQEYIVCSQHETSMEKHFKALKLTFIETFPAHAAELEQRLNKQSAQHAEKNNHSQSSPVFKP